VKISEVVLQLSKRLPLFTESFTDTLAVVSLVHSGTTATVVTSSGHDLKAGDSVHIIGAINPVTISTITHAYSGSPPVGSGVAIATTAEDHDLTMFVDDPSLNVVSIIGATQSGFNGTGMALLAVPNRRTFHYAIPKATAAAATGLPVATNASNVYNTIRGQYAVASVTNSTTFTLQHTAASNLGTQIGTITARVKPRITGAIDDEGAMSSYGRDAEDSSTLERKSKTWAYALIGDVSASKGRRNGTDALDDQTIQGDWHQVLIAPFQVLIAQDASNETLGRNSRDNAENLLGPILRSLVGKRFSTGLSQTLGSDVQFVGHGIARYDGATYWHEFNFEQRAIVGFADTVGADDDVAFRDWDFTGDPEVDEGAGQGKIIQITSLDDTPL
jgi:hypothetical protein